MPGNVLEPPGLEPGLTVVSSLLPVIDYGSVNCRIFTGPRSGGNVTSGGAPCRARPPPCGPPSGHAHGVSRQEKEVTMDSAGSPHPPAWWSLLELNPLRQACHSERSEESVSLVPGLSVVPSAPYLTGRHVPNRPAPSFRGASGPICGTRPVAVCQSAGRSGLSSAVRRPAGVNFPSPLRWRREEGLPLRLRIIAPACRSVPEPAPAVRASMEPYQSRPRPLLFPFPGAQLRQLGIKARCPPGSSAPP